MTLRHRSMMWHLLLRAFAEDVHGPLLTYVSYSVSSYTTIADFISPAPSKPSSVPSESTRLRYVNCCEVFVSGVSPATIRGLVELRSRRRCDALEVRVEQLLNRQKNSASSESTSGSTRIDRPTSELIQARLLECIEFFTGAIPASPCSARSIIIRVFKSRLVSPVV